MDEMYSASSDTDCLIKLVWRHYCSLQVNPKGKQKDLFLKLEKPLIQELKVWSDHNTLKMHINKKFYQGVFSLKKLSTTIFSPTFLTKWNNILSECSSAFIKLIILRNKRNSLTFDRRFKTFVHL